MGIFFIQGGVMKKKRLTVSEGHARQNRMRVLPRVDDCVARLRASLPPQTPKTVITTCVRGALASVREEMLAMEVGGDQYADIKERVLDMSMKCAVDKLRPRFRPLINATGVIVHTNLGRSLLPLSTMDALLAAGSHYANLEFDLESGKRGSRYSLIEELICELTGAEAALVVNNNAAAVLIVLETLAKGKEVIVSRGQLVEIGGSFRIPDVMARSGAHLVEVGATNRTHLRDYEAALTENTALLLRVHCSNYRIIGFTKQVANEELVNLGRRFGIPVYEDLGSGCFVDLSRFGLQKEPTVQEVLASGVDVVSFSGDKLLGGPQAGIILGRRALIEQIKKNPLNRALRIDKFTLAGLESILQIYRDESRALQEIPTLRLIATPVEVVQKKAAKLLRFLDFAGKGQAEIIETVSRVGGGAMPEQALASYGVAVTPVVCSVNQVEKRLRQREIPVIGRVEKDRWISDMRTVHEDEVEELAGALNQCL